MTTAPTRTAAAGVGVWQTFRETPASVRALLLGSLINRLGAYLQIFLVLYLVHVGYSAGQAGWALGMFGAGGILGGFLGGWLVDRIGPRDTIAVSSAAAGVLTVGVLYAPNYPSVLVLVVLIGAGNQAFRPASAASFAEHTPRGRYVMVFAMQRLAINAGATFGPLLGALIVKVSYGGLFWVEGGVTAGLAVLALVVLPADRAPARDKDTATDTATATVTATAAASVSAEGTVADGTRAARGRMLADWRFLLFLLGAFLSSAVYIQCVSTLPLQVSALGMSTAVYGVLATVNGIVVALFELPLTKITQHWSARPPVIGGFALIGIGMSLYSVSSGMVGLVLVTIVWSAGEILSTPTMFAYPAKIAPDRERGRYLGACGAVIGASFAIGPILGTFGWNRFGHTIWQFCLIVSAAAILAGFFGIQRGTEDGPTRRRVPRQRTSELS
ncbi:MFS transporter [Solihabitans fulvus]|uniref:MFS transporter n=1 Tax=Solihabitans fulvus TaxID=1892852 RepID=A0A5B2WWQ3_9PSEU|nr:MFS transporter [Solihabitans fulvus]KAA2255935.1 MFS transporter [Solihabitans fulvus]